MAEKFYSLLTKIGKAKIANSIGFGTKINFTKMKVGDGGGSYYEPTEEQTDLKNTVWEGNINHVEIDKDNLNWIHIELMIPATVGGFTIREYGAFDDENNLIGICKCAETYKPVITDGSTKELLLDLILCVVNTENIQLKIDPTIIFAKKSDLEVLDNKINNIKIPVTKVNEKTGDITLKAEDINCNDGKSVESHLDEIAKEQEKVFQSVSNGKSTVASAITDKGVNTLATDSFNTMANNIKNIKTGYEKGDTIESNRLEIRYNYNLPLCKLFAYNYGSFNNFTMNLSNDGKYIFMKYNTNTSSTYVNIYNVNSREIISGKYITSSTSNYYSYFDDINNIYISTYKTASEFEIYLCDLLNPGVNKKIFSINISDVNSNIYGFFDNKNKYIYISIINKYTLKIDYNGNKISEVSNELITEISNNAIGKIFAQDDYVYIFYKYNTVKIKKISTGEIVNTLELDNYFEYIKWHNNYIYVISRNANIIKKYKIENGISLISSRSIPSSINYLRWSIDPLNENIISNYLTDVGNSQYHVLKFHSSINVSCYKDWELKLADVQMHFKPCYLNIIDNNIFIGSHKDSSSRSEDFHHYCLYPDISSVKIKEEKLI